MNDNISDLMKYSSIYCKMDCKVLMGGYGVCRSLMLEHVKIYVDSFNNSINGIYIYIKQCMWLQCVSNQWCITTTHY